jgi:hypothetical protein
MYAFNAQSGAVRWRHRAGGRISGSSTVIGNVVYFSDLGSKTTAGLNVVTGQQVFSFPDGAFTPIIADYHAVYLDGYISIYQLLPGRAPAARHKRRARRRAAAAAHHASRHAKHAKHAKHKAKRKAKRKVRHAQRKRKVRHAQRKRKVRHAQRKK